MDQTLPAPWLAVGLFVGMLACLEIGRRLGLRQRQRGDPSAGFSAVDGAVFALFGLIVAFTFSGAAARFDSRRMQIAEEANAIGTAWLRIDLVAAEDQAPVRQLFREYLDTRIEVYRVLPDLDAALKALKRASDLQSAIWALAMPAIRRQDAHPQVAILLVPALNEMFDITTTRTMAARMHPPNVVYYLLVLVGLACSLLAGHAMAAGQAWSWLHAVIFAAFIALSIYVILDIEYPRAGMIRLSAFDQVLIDLRESMK